MKIKGIKNLDGEVIFTYDEDDEKWAWGKYDLSGVNLERANLEGAIWMDVILHKANLKEAQFSKGFLQGIVNEMSCYFYFVYLTIS